MLKSRKHVGRRSRLLAAAIAVLVLSCSSTASAFLFTEGADASDPGQLASDTSLEQPLFDEVALGLQAGVRLQWQLFGTDS